MDCRYTCLVVLIVACQLMYTFHMLTLFYAIFYILMATWAVCGSIGGTGAKLQLCVRAIFAGALVRVQLLSMFSD